jgi:hypothetical protein
MGDDGAETEVEQPQDPGLETVVEWSGRWLEQDPPSATAEGNRPQFGPSQSVERRARDLPAAQHRNADAGSAERSSECTDAVRQFGDADVVVVTDVGRRAHCRDAVRERLPGHAERVVEIARPVIEARQDVAVQIDQGTAT